MTNTNDTLTIWQNYHLDFEDYEEDLRELHPNASLDELMNLMYEQNWEDLEVERENLDIDVGTEIVCIADIGRWNGRRSGYRIIHSGNIRDCLYLSNDCDYGEFYVDPDSHDFYGQESHHDGTNYLRYRAFRKGISDTQREYLLDKLYTGFADEALIRKTTKPLGSYIAKVYGWKLNRTPAAVGEANAS